MGLFSTKKKTHVNTSVCRMVEDDDYTPSHKLAMLEYTMSEASSSTRVADETLVDYLINAQNSSIVFRARAARNYASKSDYAYGLPKANLLLSEAVDIPGLLDDHLQRTLGHPVNVIYGIFGPMNNLHFLREMLVQKYDYNQVTNELVSESVRIGKTCYLESAVIKYSKYTADNLIDPETLIQHGYSTVSGKTHTRKEDLKAKQVPWVNNVDIDNDIAVVTVTYKDGDTVVTYNIELNFLEYESSSKPITTGLDDSDTDNYEPEAITPDVSPNFDEADFYQAFYEYERNGVIHKDYFTYKFGSGLSTTLDEAFTSEEELGQYFPRMYARMGGQKCNDEAKKDTPEYKAMVGLGRKLGLNWASWVDAIHDAVGSVGSVSQMFMTFALPANTTDPLIQKYLYEYFAALHGKTPKQITTTEYKSLQTEYIEYGVRQGQTLLVADKGYTQQLSFSGIGYKDIQGSIGEVGSFSSEMITKGVSLNRGSLFGNLISSTTGHCYRKQVTKTTYREYIVYGLRTVEFVNGGYTTTAAGDSENLLIQLDASIAHEFSVRERELIYSKSMHIVLHTIQVVKTKWYQTGIFKAILFVIAVIISFYTGPGGMAFYQAVAYAVVKTIIISVVVNMAVKFMVVKFNLNVGIIAAVIAVIAIAYGAYVGLGDTVGIAGATALDMINVASQAFSMSSVGYVVQTMEAVKAFTETMAGLSEQAKQVAERAKELGLDASHNPAMLMFEPPIGIGIRMGESPDDYFQRSIHSGNIGTTVYHLLESSVELSTALPSQTQILNNIKEIYA